MTRFPSLGSTIGPSRPSATRPRQADAPEAFGSTSRSTYLRPMRWRICGSTTPANAASAPATNGRKFVSQLTYWVVWTLTFSCDTETTLPSSMTSLQPTLRVSMWGVGCSPGAACNRMACCCVGSIRSTTRPAAVAASSSRSPSVDPSVTGVSEMARTSQITTSSGGRARSRVSGSGRAFGSAAGRVAGGIWNPLSSPNMHFTCTIVKSLAQGTPQGSFVQRLWLCGSPEHE